MKKISAILLLMVALSITSATQVQAQNYSVVGTVVDSLTLEGEPSATLRVLKQPQQQPADTVPVALGVTDMQGRFNLPLKRQGSYQLVVTSVGRTPIIRPFSVSSASPRADLGKLLISEASEMLKGVEVVAQKPLVKMDVDELAYSVADDPDSKTNTLLDMLRKVPLVTVDGEDNIKVNGSSSFQVFVNGKPNAMLSANPSQTFKAIPASMVKSVSVITNPGAKYDAEGVGGVLNIVFIGGDQSMEGYSLNLTAMGGTRQQGGGFYAMVQKGKLTLSSSFFGVHAGIKDCKNETLQERADGSGISSEGVATAHVQALFGNFDLSYEMDTLNTLSASVNITNMPQQTRGWSATRYLQPGGSPAFGYDTRLNNHAYNTAINGSLDYRHTFAGNKAHTLDLAYRISTQPRKNRNASLFSIDGSAEAAHEAGFEDWLNTDRNNLQEHTFQADYAHPLGKGQTLETGVKYILRRGTSKVLYGEALTPELDYRHESNIAALYGSYALQHKAFGLKAGLRYEYTDQQVNYFKGDGEDFGLNYDNLVPSLSLSYTPAMGQQLGAGYNMRISRPGIGYLNPFVNDQDPTHITYGNPGLSAEKAHNLNMSYNLFTSVVMLNATLRHSFQNNSIEELTRKEADGVLYTTYGNVGKRRSTELNLFINFNLSPKTRLTLNSATSYVHLQSASTGYRNHGWQQSGMASLQHTLPWNLRFSGTYMVNSRTLNLQGQSSGMTMHIFSLTKPFLKEERLNVSIVAVNPFCKDLKIENITRGADFTNSVTTHVPIRSFTLSVSLRLGNLKPKQRVAKAGNDDLIDRRDQNSEMNGMMIQGN